MFAKNVHAIAAARDRVEALAAAASARQRHMLEGERPCGLLENSTIAGAAERARTRRNTQPPRLTNESKEESAEERGARDAWVDWLDAHRDNLASQRRRSNDSSFYALKHGKPLPVCLSGEEVARLEVAYKRADDAAARAKKARRAHHTGGGQHDRPCQSTVAVQPVAMPPAQSLTDDELTAATRHASKLIARALEKQQERRRPRRASAAA